MILYRRNLPANLERVHKRLLHRTEIAEQHLDTRLDSTISLRVFLLQATANDNVVVSTARIPHG